MATLCKPNQDRAHFRLCPDQAALSLLRTVNAGRLAARAEVALSLMDGSRMVEGHRGRKPANSLAGELIPRNVTT